MLRVQAAYLMLAARAVGAGLWADVRLQQQQGRRRIFPRRAMEIELPLLSRPWRSVASAHARRPLQIRRGLSNFVSSVSNAVSWIALPKARKQAIFRSQQATTFISALGGCDVLTMKVLARVDHCRHLRSARLALPAQAENWPTRTVRFIVPLGPGSGVDIGCAAWSRIGLANEMGSSRCVVENQTRRRRDRGDQRVSLTPTITTS